jgi:hypothetical protein
MSDQAYESFQMMTQAQRDKPDVDFEGNSRYVVKSKRREARCKSCVASEQEMQNTPIPQIQSFGHRLLLANMTFKDCTGTFVSWANAV